MEIAILGYHTNFANGKKGAAAYPLVMLLKAILFCYSRGIISSRKIEKACRENIIAKALAEGIEPDHSWIAAFISTNSEEIRDLFSQVLFKCSELKLITGEMFAIDGCKLPSNASKECSGKIEELKKKRSKLEKYIERVIKQHSELDKNEKAHPHGAVEKKIKRYAKTMGTREDWNVPQFANIVKQLSLNNNH